MLVLDQTDSSCYLTFHLNSPGVTIGSLTEESLQLWMEYKLKSAKDFIPGQ